MVDVALLAVAAWCTLLLAGRGIYEVLAYTGGVLAGGYAGMQTSGWVMTHWLSPASPAMLWVERHIRNPVDSVMALASWLPPEPASATLTHTQWIAGHVVQVVFTACVTCAVFTLFVVSARLSDALWDRRAVAARWRERLASTGCAALCGVYVAGLLAVTLANLAWLDAFHWVGVEMQQSWAVRLLAAMADWRGLS
jgi:hypothetical protein